MNKVIIHRRRGLSELHGLKAAQLHPITEKESNKQTIQAAPKRNQLRQPMKPIAMTNATGCDSS